MKTTTNKMSTEKINVGFKLEPYPCSGFCSYVPQICSAPAVIVVLLCSSKLDGAVSLWNRERCICDTPL